MIEKFTHGLERLLHQDPLFAFAVCFLASAGFNGLYGYGEASGAAAYIYGACYVAFAVVAAWLPIRMVALKGPYRWLGRAVMAVPLAACFLVSQSAGWQTLGLSVATGAAERDKGALLTSSAQAALEQYQTERARIGTVRAVETIAAQRDFECRITSKAYPNGKGPRCTALMAEEGAAKRAVELDRLIAEARDGLKDGDVVVTSQRGAQSVLMFVNWIGARLDAPAVTIDQVRATMVVIFVLLLDVVGTFGWAMTGRKVETIEGWNSATLIEQGLLEHPGAGDVMAFKIACLERGKGQAVPTDLVFETYRRWAEAAGREAIKKDAFLRMCEAIGMTRAGDQFVGVGLKGAQLATVA